ncbi:hypothetical protein [Actinoalloteichus hymeniacidonis]|uniref:hypothetical protein n=1 Tax=Actinoalloteichus hymeniacidonis TaxID=340345 RepID=UPI0008539B2E|nr:hypothetical protein [Actinoalloteichus hymeniacidonis]
MDRTPVLRERQAADHPMAGLPSQARTGPTVDRAQAADRPRCRRGHRPAATGDRLALAALRLPVPQLRVRHWAPQAVPPRPAWAQALPEVALVDPAPLEVPEARRGVPASSRWPDSASTSSRPRSSNRRC